MWTLNCSYTDCQTGHHLGTYSKQHGPNCRRRYMFGKMNHHQQWHSRHSGERHCSWGGHCLLHWQWWVLAFVYSKWPRAFIWAAGIKCVLHVTNVASVRWLQHKKSTDTVPTATTAVGRRKVVSCGFCMIAQMYIGTSAISQKRLGCKELSQVENTLRLISVVLNWLIIISLMLSYWQK